jgi:hypothetical protein
MESMNKFKVLTVLIICVFVFAIAAMYVNTKDASEQRAQEHSEYEEEDYDNVRSNKQSAGMSDLMYAVSRLENRVNQLEEKNRKNESLRKNTSPTTDSGVRCKIFGTVSGARIEQISPDAALQDARINGNDLVLTCSLR